MTTLLNDFDLNFKNTKNTIKTLLLAALTISLIAVSIANCINPQQFTF